MVLKAFTVRDQKAEIFHTPFFKKTHGEAERDFATLCQDDKSTIWKFPEDFDLYYAGEYDDQTGIYKSLDTPQHIVKAVQCINKQ